jgi:hypothetical protein
MAIIGVEVKYPLKMKWEGAEADFLVSGFWALNTAHE